jgi:phosphoribosylglycinamide formyltransferase 1
VAGRIVVLISGSGSNMEALADACDRGEIEARVAAVVSDRDCLGLVVARTRGLQTELLEPGDHESREQWSDALRALVARYQPDLVVTAGFMRILAPVFVDAFYGRIINLHPSLLPAFAGAHAVRAALDYGVKITGSTIHFTDRHVDHGPIIMQKPVPVRAGDDEETLHERIKTLEHRLLPEVCRLWFQRRIHLAGRWVEIDER